MSLVSGPGRGGVSRGDVPDELKLVVDEHVKYIQSLDTVSYTTSDHFSGSSFTDSAKMSSNTG